MIYLGADKHGLTVIKVVENYLKKNKIKFINLGVTSEDQDVKLEDLIPKVTKEILTSENNKGIFVCGTGVGVAVGANKIKGIRASLATDEEVAEWSVVYDNCNVLCLSGWKKDQYMINKILYSFFGSRYDGSEKRLQMMKAFDNWR